MDFMCDLEPFSEIRSHLLYTANDSRGKLSRLAKKP